MKGIISKLVLIIAILLGGTIFAAQKETLDVDKYYT